MVMLGVTSLSTFVLVFKTSEEWPQWSDEEWPQWSDDGEAAPIAVDEGVRLRTLEPVPPPLPSPPLSSPPLLETLTSASIQTKNKSTILKPTLYVLTTGVRHFQAPQAFTTTTVMGQEQTATVGPTFDEGYGPRQWPEGAKRVVDGHVTVWRKIAAECSGWCFVSEDDAIWPNGIPSELPSDGFVSFFKEAVCGQAKGVYSENYDSVVKAVIPGKCMPYGAVAYAITGDFAKMLLSNLPMSKPVDHFLWEQAVVQKKAYVSRQYIVRHKKGKSLRQNTVQHPPPNADNPVPMLHNNSGYILYKDVDQLGSDIGKSVADARGVCSRTPSCVGYNHMGWMKSSVGNVHKRKGMSLYVKRKHSLQMYPSEAFKQPTIDCNLEFNGPVDVVYTWVNWTHPAYIAQMRANGIFDGETKEPNMNYDRTATSDSYNELRYSMASLLKNDNKDQIRNIYVVINPIHGPPSWLNISHPRIKMIHHNTLLPQTPTNNAWAIVTCLHRIPGLSSWFLALNDDVILNRPLKLSSKEIPCPRGEVTDTHCPTLRNTCLMGQLETHFQKEVDQVYNYRKKSTLEYRPEIILWLEHHNWLVANGHAVVAVTDWFGKMNTNGWRHDPKWVGETWQRVIEKEGRKTWLNFQGQGISWEYPENPTIRSLFNAWIHNQHYPLHSAFFKKNPQTPHHTIIDDADRANSSDMPNIEHFPNTVQYPPPNADNPAFTLLQNEGSHKQFDKTWSKYNKFLTDKGFLKLGTDNVAHEWLYWSIAMALNATELFIGVPSVVSMCDDASVLTSQLQTPPEFKLPLYGILVKYEPSVKRGWSQTKHCKNLQSQRVLKMLFIDYLVGHSDRPSNCHTISDKVYAIDNDGVTITPKLQDWNNDIQENILHKALKDENYKPQILQKIKPYLTLPLDVDALRNNMKETFHCSMDMHKHFETLISSVIFRLNHLKYLQNKSEGIDSVSIGKLKDLKMLDFWDISSKKLPKHTAVGGTHMSTDIKRFSDVWKSSDMPNIEHFPKIAVAIPTYNRAGYVQLCAAALSKTIPSNDVWIFDDHSTEYTVGDVQKWFGSHSVQRNAKRFKADKQARHILEWFVGTDYDWLITLDSDLIVRPDWLELLRGMLPHTQGVMSLYHSGNPTHPTLHCDPHLCEMKSLGNAGVAWSKVLAKRMLVDMTQSDGFDWGWTEWLRKQKIPQYAAKDSLVLHIGMHGTWGADSKREKSVGFPMDKLSPDVRGRAEMFLKGMQ
tara:strand:+ start:24273 stop:27977 length:3705 start_codon:yes stop_codon:yes gene_type:complete